MTEKTRAFPPVVYVPTTTPDGEDEPRLELIELVDGRTALFVYSAMDRLADFYRADAPWALLSVADLQRAHDASPYDVLYLDRRPQLPGDAASERAVSEKAASRDAGRETS